MLFPAEEGAKGLEPAEGAQRRADAGAMVGRFALPTSRSTRKVQSAKFQNEANWDNSNYFCWLAAVAEA